MSIKDNKHYNETYHDFDIFQNCFGNTKIMPTDIDGVIERYGNFLFMEFKPYGKELSRGQHILYKRLSLINKFTVIIFYHKERINFHDKLEILGMEQYPIKKYDEFNNYINNKLINITNKEAIEFVENWFKIVDNFEEHKKSWINKHYEKPM